jgi:regulator of RNase E activity RraA
VPVVLRGVGALPGGYVFADDSGAAVIPAAEVERVIEGARAAQREEADSRERIASERIGTGAGRRRLEER